jgi:hypothetical protein
MSYSRNFLALLIMAVGAVSCTYTQQMPDSKQFEHLLFVPEPAEAHLLLDSIPANHIFYDEDQAKSLLHYVIDAAFWYEASLNEEKELKHWLESFGVTIPRAILGTYASIAAIVLFSTQGRIPDRAVGAPMKTALSGKATLGIATSSITLISSIIAWGSQLPHFTQEGLAEMITMIQEIAQRTSEIDASTQNYIDQSCMRSSESLVVQKALEQLKSLNVKQEESVAVA